MSKTQALGWALGCLIAGPLLIFTHLPMFVFCGGSALTSGIIFAIIWCYKFSRDRGIIQNARLEAEQEPALMPPMTSPGSSRLFVPPPLDRP